MRRVLKWLAWGVGGLFGLIILLLVVGFIVSEVRLRQTYDVAVKPVAIPTDEASIAFGEHLGTGWTACTECHGDNLEGDVMSDDMFGRLTAPNLTAGVGGIGDTYTDEDWVRAIRHNVKSNGKPAFFMFGELSKLSDEELGAIIAWAKSVPAVDNAVPPTQIRLPGRLFVLMAPGMLFPASEIDHDAVPGDPPPVGPTAAYGEHIARIICTQCHGDDLAGGQEITDEEGNGSRVAADLTRAGNLARWTEDDFFTALTTGVTPEGKVLDDEFMPWEFLGLNDTELAALWAFVQTVEPPPPET